MHHPGGAKFAEPIGEQSSERVNALGDAHQPFRAVIYGIRTGDHRQ